MSTDFSKLDAPAREIKTENIDSEMKQSYIEYAMSVIVGRSLPDVRDGLKPVHRRILYAMYQEGVTSNTSHRKSSNVVGETMGNYHPHGDSAIYDSLVRMAQDFSLREPLIDGQGNFGSIDGDEAAAMRYTEARMSKIGELMLDDIEYDTVEMTPTYDDRNEEPEVLPSAFPNLLVNGSSGIAVGMSTKIPSHNLNEVIDAVVHRIRNPNCSIDDLHEHIKGPDFPTGGEILDDGAILESYKTGRGKLRIRPSYHIEETDSGKEKIIITEIPVEKEKSKIIERIADDVNEGNLTSIADLRDESDRDGIRIVVELKRDAVTDVVVNRLINDKLVHTFGVIMLALVDGEPKLLTLDEMLDEYIDHRKDVVERRTKKKLQSAKDEFHKITGKIQAVENATEVVDIIRDSKNRDIAIETLVTELDFSEEQAQHVTRMQLGSLTSLDQQNLIEDKEKLSENIERYNEILESDQVLRDVIVDEQKAIKDKFGSERRTDIVTDYQHITDEDLLPEEESLYVLTTDGYIKRVPADKFSPQGRNGKGVRSVSLRQDASIKTVFCGSTHDMLYFFTNTGQAYSCKGYDIPSYGRNAKGEPIIQLNRVSDDIQFDDDETIQTIVSVEKDEFDESDDFIFATENGLVKRLQATELENVRQTGIKAISLADNDKIASSTFATEDATELFITTKYGKSIRFDKSEASRVGRTAKGVNGIKLEDDDNVVSVTTLSDSSDSILSVRSDGKGRLTTIDNYSKQSRYGKGKMDMKLTDDTTIVRTLVADGKYVVLSSTGGNTIIIDTEEISTVSRRTVGVGLMAVEDSEQIASVEVCSSIAPSE